MNPFESAHPQTPSSRPKAALFAAAAESAHPQTPSSRPKAALFAAAAERPLSFVRRSALLSTRLASIVLAWIALLTVTLPASAHVGNKDVFEQLQAGPYTLFITIRPPNVIPGVASVEVRTSGPSITSLTITPMPLTGEASKHPPTPDAMQRATSDLQFYTGSIWLMREGSWQVRFTVDGASGPATAAVPVAAVPLSILPMQKPLGTLLAVLGLILALGMAAIVAAAVRESRLPPNTQPDPAHRSRSLLAFAVSFAFVAFIILLGAHWWNVEAAGYAADIYHPSDLRLSLQGSTLHLLIGKTDSDADDPKAWKPVHNDDLLLDHGHLMHLYAIRFPQMDAAFHLHPTPTGDKGLALQLPAMPPGTYKLFADVVYLNGFPETELATLTIPPGLSTASLGPEDAAATPAPLSAGELGPSYKLPDGYTLAWDRPANITANTAYSFRFTLLDPTGKPATDMQPYLGMAGHAAFVKADGATFAHTHPEGSAAMPAVMLANQGLADTPMDMSSMPAMTMPTEAIPSTVAFPYGFPTPGRYRIFIQMKHSNMVETGVFDAEVH